MDEKSKSFIEKANKVHSNTYDYTDLQLINYKTNVRINCNRHGKFFQRPDSHLSGRGCPKCGNEKMGKSNRKNTASFIQKAKDIHGEEYDYSKVYYSTADTKVEIGCSIHGSFFQTPASHLQKSGCNECRPRKTSERCRLTTEEFINRSILKHNNFYDYSKTNYIDSNTKVTVSCPNHGDFEIIAKNHLRGSRCTRCGRLKTGAKTERTTEHFIEDANSVHNNRYSYEETIFINTKEKVKINCKLHGGYTQNAANHLNGQGCPKCANNAREMGYSRSDYIKKANGRICTFYTLRCFNEEEYFYKIGITMNTLKERYPTIKFMPYSYEIISEIYGEAGTIWDLEKMNMKKLHAFKYQPNLVFGGSKRECFTQYTIDEAK